MGRYKNKCAVLRGWFLVAVMGSVVGGSTLLSGCTRVQPWERQYLANPYMATNPDPLKTKLRQHVYESKEGARGGYGAGGGGCGCN